MINETPLEEINIKNSRVTIMFDDVFEKRRKVSFSPYQGVKANRLHERSSILDEWKKVMQYVRSNRFTLDKYFKKEFNQTRLYS